MQYSKYKNIEKSMCFNRKSITVSDTVELLGITLDNNINFKRHKQNICHKANSKTKALLNLEEAQVLAETYILSNFRYRPLFGCSVRK